MHTGEDVPEDTADDRGDRNEERDEMKPDAIERMECSHHDFCCQIESHGGCNKCKRFEYSRQDWLRREFEETKGLIVPYDYNIEFNRRVSVFTVSKGTTMGFEL